MKQFNRRLNGIRGKERVGLAYEKMERIVTQIPETPAWRKRNADTGGRRKGPRSGENDAEATRKGGNQENIPMGDMISSEKTEAWHSVETGGGAEEGGIEKA